MKYRKLRIAWSVGWAIACLLLVALWVRSYSTCDAITALVSTAAAPNQQAEETYATLCSNAGTIYVLPSQTTSLQRAGWSYKTIAPVRSYPINSFWEWDDSPGGTYGVQLSAERGSGSQYVAVPYWLVIIFLAVVAALSWVKFQTRFSLRRLLMVMSVTSILLGWLVYMIRS